jgi:hypothetical protein
LSEKDSRPIGIKKNKFDRPAMFIFHDLTGDRQSQSRAFDPLL